MEEFKFVETTKIICDRVSYFTIRAESYEDALSRIRDGINRSLPYRDLSNEGDDIEITDCQYSCDYEVVSELIENKCGGETVFYEKRKDI